MSILEKRSTERSLLVMVLDVSPVVWRMRSAFREKSDQSRRAKGKESVGPGILEEILSSIQLWCGAFATLQRECAVLIIGVAGNATALLYPRKDTLQSYFLISGGRRGNWDWESLPSQFIDGVAELIQQNHAAEDTAAMAAGLSLALCHINRFLVAHQSGSKAGGVSALYHDPTTPSSANDDKDVMALIGNNNASTTKRRSAIQAGNWSPRILLIQASNDRSQDYNAFMNCTFAAVKQNIVLDGCFLPSGMGKDPKNSSFLEQACDRTGGIYLAPSGMAQVGPAWSELLFALFLAPRTARPALTRPNIPSVDFRARCFLTGNSVSIAHVCNQCLSIFQNCPSESCPTCGAPILNDKTMTTVTNGTK